MQDAPLYKPFNKKQNKQLSSSQVIDEENHDAEQDDQDAAGFIKAVPDIQIPCTL